ncbi:LysR family transcriptional regulator [Rhodobacteraceae bacterium S2214]|nr:LysR family transcriptional regulator [Rhodobacteraceae bacterium S2214]
MMDWNDLQYVLALKEGGTMKQAAILLRTDPTTVSRHIKRIAIHFETDLFKMQKGGKWVLTTQGEELTTLAKNFKKGLDQFQLGEGGSTECETIVITSLEFLLTHYLSPKIESGMNCFPDTKLSLVAADRRLSLAYGEADIALRFGRPTEGHLITSKIADISFDLVQLRGTKPKEWIGLQEDLDWTPDMRGGVGHFGKPPILRVSSYAAAREAAIATGHATVGPSVIMREGGQLETMPDTSPVHREVWSVIHETRRLSQRLAAVRTWIKNAVLEMQLQQHNMA